MARPTTDWKRAATDFATTYLLPVLGIFVMVIVGLGLLGIAGFLLRHVAIPIAIVLVLLALVALLTVEMVWRLSTFNALLGLIFTYPAVVALMREPLQAIFGIVIGALGALTLHLYGDTLKASEQQRKVMNDPTGQTHQVVILSKNMSPMCRCWLWWWSVWRSPCFAGDFANTALGTCFSVFSLPWL